MCSEVFAKFCGTSEDAIAISVGTSVGERIIKTDARRPTAAGFSAGNAGPKSYVQTRELPANAGSPGGDTAGAQSDARNRDATKSICRPDPTIQCFATAATGERHKSV